MVIHPNVVKSAKLSVRGLFGFDQLRRAAQKFCVCLCGPFCCQFASWGEGGCICEHATVCCLIIVI